MSGKVESEIARLTTLSSADRKDRWRRLIGTPVPRVSPAMLRLAVAWEIQARAYGGLSRGTQRKLDQLAAAKTTTRAVALGMRLMREWRGRANVVTIGEDAVIRWDDREWRRLSEVARAITGTRWSGPAFFGLKQKGGRALGTTLVRWVQDAARREGASIALGVAVDNPGARAFYARLGFGTVEDGATYCAMRWPPPA